MLYATTRNSSDIYTVHRALRENRAPDGGLYIPHRIIPFSWDELSELEEQSVNQCIASVLNRLLRLKLSADDLDPYTAGSAVRLRSLSHKIYIGECRHNARGSFSRLVRDIGRLVPGEDCGCTPALEVAVRIAVSFGLYGEMRRRGMTGEFDAVCVSGDFYGPVGFWTAREMGLPIKNIVMCCNENDSVWSLFHHGAFRTDTRCVTTAIPQADIALPDGLEYYIRICCGSEALDAYLDAVRQGSVYCPDLYTLDKLRAGMYVSVVSTSAALNTVRKVIATGDYFLSPGTALAYAGLLDYRSAAGQSRWALIFSEDCPDAANDPRRDHA